MYLEQSNVIYPMTAEELWMSQPELQKYPLEDLKRYNKNIRILVSNKVMCVATEEAFYQEDMQDHPQKHTTCRGTPF
jgi:hypothetical protein